MTCSEVRPQNKNWQVRTLRWMSKFFRKKEFKKIEFWLLFQISGGKKTSDFFFYFHLRILRKKWQFSKFEKKKSENFFPLFCVVCSYFYFIFFFYYYFTDENVKEVNLKQTSWFGEFFIYIKLNLANICFN